MDSPETSEYNSPSITVVDVPIEKMAAESIKLIVDILEHKVEKICHKQFDTELIVRESCPL